MIPEKSAFRDMSMFIRMLGSEEKTMLKRLKGIFCCMKSNKLFDGPLQARQAKFEREVIRYGLGVQPAYCMCAEEAWEDYMSEFEVHENHFTPV
ncbi:conserved hypothetical protein [delta proteobacterium NaphS2]|nr:conserved hypothetical protein [delta proteobacterium NaphS2]